MKNHLFRILILFVLTSASAQKKDRVLFEINGDPTYVSEFTKLFNSEANSLKEKNFEEDLQLMVDYKLKLKQSKIEGIDTSA
ncbi:MAG: hypothetical protein ABF273_03435, partial [Wenyingzhuangia sp.]